MLWTQRVGNMKQDGVGTYYEVGTDDTLQKIVARMCPDQIVTSIWNLPAYQGMYNYENV